MALPSCRPNAAGWRRTSVKQYGHKPAPGYHLGPSRLDNIKEWATFAGFILFMGLLFFFGIGGGNLL